MAPTVSAPFGISFPYFHQMFAAPVSDGITFNSSRPRRRKPISFPFPGNFGAFRQHCRIVYEPNSSSFRRVLRRVSGDGAIDASQKEPAVSDGGELKSSSTFGDSYVALFVRMLGLDNDPLDREQAIVALWKYSLGGKKCIDAIMQFHGCINLIVNLLKSEASSCCEAAAGLLRSISSINVYRDSVAESGAIEELTGLLSRPSLTSEVKEQSICTLWNLSVDEDLRVKIATADVLQLLVKSLDDEDIKVKEAAGGVLANLALSHGNHNRLVEAGIIPKLANLLKADAEGFKVIRKEAKNALLELAKDNYYRILIVEEGLIPVPMVGASAYKSFTPGLYSWPSLPDGTEIERTSKSPSKFGASELLLGLNVDKDVNIDEAKVNAIVGCTQQQFLARIGAVELDDGLKTQSGHHTDELFTLLPWMDGVARLVLILGLEDEQAISRAAQSIADSSINEHMRISFKEAGAVKHLICLLDHNSDAVKLAVACALERLSASPAVCQTIEAEGGIHPLVGILKQVQISESLMEKTLDVLAQVLDPSKEMRSKFYDEPVNGSKYEPDATRNRGPSAGLAANGTKIPVPTSNSRKEILDSVIIARLIEILKSSSLHLQRKAASILEFVAINDSSMEAMTSLDIASGLSSVFQQKDLVEGEDVETQEPEKYALQLEEVGLTISTASRLLTRLLESEQFSQTINSNHFTKLLREILKSDIPFHHKDWIAACLVKLTSLSSTNGDFEIPINTEVTIYETIPRLVEQLKSSCFPEVQEAAVVELNRIISEGVVGSSLAVAAEGAIFPLVKLVDEGSDRAAEAAIAILHNLSMDSENHPAILAAGAVPALKRIVLAQRPQWTRALRLLRNLPI